MTGLLEAPIYCPYCGEKVVVVIEVLDESQEYIEDCQVCCRPITFEISVSIGGDPMVAVRSEDDSF